MPVVGQLRVVLLKPGKYGVHGDVERFRRGFMPNSTLTYIHSMTPASLDGVEIVTCPIDEYVRTDLDYLDLLRTPDRPTLLALVGVQSHQFHRALDLAAFARESGVEHCVIGGPHPMTCDVSMLQGRGVSFALAEAETIWLDILRDAIRGELRPVYGSEGRWSSELPAPVLKPPDRRDLQRYVIPMLGIYPSRGCPFTCNFCSVIKIAGRKIRSQPVDTTIATLKAAKAAKVRMVMFVSDNFNKYPEAPDLLNLMIEEKIEIPFFVQCDTQVAKQEEFIALLAKARCFEMFVGVESFNRQTLLSAHKAQNYPERYGEIVGMCRRYGIQCHFSNIIGFPGDTAGSIREHVSILRGLSPDTASFYILCPIPGTQQYDEFQAAGWITEDNLDRFDATTATWRHPSLRPEQLEALLFECYRQFYTPARILKTAISSLGPNGTSAGLIAGLGHPLFSRYSAWQKMHPMSGGIGRVRLDSDKDYRHFRRKLYGFDRVPLPKSLQLCRADEELNQRVNVAV